MVNVAGLIAAVYPRCSIDRNDAASVNEQEELGLARCNSEDWTPRVYGEDNDVSASRYAKKDRKDWPRLLADLRAGLLQVVWLYESSRGDRKAYEWLGFLEDCRDHEVRVYVETHGRLYDIRNARDWKTLAEDGVNNAYASDETSLRIKRNAAANARRGRPNGPVPYGYTRRYHEHTGKYAGQDPALPEAGIAEEIITRIAKNDPLVAIARDLEARGIRAPAGGIWCTATLRKIARNPAYAGCRKTPEGTLVKGWPEIVSLETHLAAAAVLTGPGRSTQRPGRQLHLLSYLAACGGCGGPLHVMRHHYGRQPRYQCRAHGCVSVDPEWLDGLVEDLVCDVLSAADAAEVFRSDSEAAAKLRAEAAKLRAQLDEWAAADISARSFAIKEAKLLPQIERAESAAKAAELPLVLKDLLEADDTRAEWDGIEVPARRAVIRALMTVQVDRAADRSRAARTDPDRVTIKWLHG